MIKSTGDAVELLDRQWKYRLSREEILSPRLRQVLTGIAHCETSGMHSSAVIGHDVLVVEIQDLSSLGLIIRCGPFSNRWRRTVLGEYVVGRLIRGDDWT